MESVLRKDAYGGVQGFQGALRFAKLYVLEGYLVHELCIHTHLLRCVQLILSIVSLTL